MESFQSVLDFKVWEYTVSHSSLLLRHHALDSSLTVDILFSGVLYWDIPHRFEGLTIGLPTADEEESLRRRCQKEKELLPDYQPYLLLTGSARYFLMASSCCVYENQQGWESSLADYWKGCEAELLYRHANPAARAYEQQHPPA